MNKKPSTKTDVVRLRVSPEEKNGFRQCAEKLGLSMTDYIRSLHQREVERLNSCESVNG